MVPIDTPRKRIAFLIITIALLSFTATTVHAATKPVSKKTSTTQVKTATTTAKKTATKAATKVATTTTKPKTIVKGEKVTAKAVTVVGNNSISTYTVKKGDTISTIAKKFDITTNTIRWSNGINSKATIKVGDKLTILPTSGIIYEVKNGDTLGEIAQKFGADQDDILNANDLDNANSLKLGMKLHIPNVEPLDSDSVATSTHDTATVTENISPIDIPQPQTTVSVISPVDPVAVIPVAILTPAPGTTMMVTNPVTEITYPITVKQSAAATKYTIPSNDIRGYYAQPVSGKLSQGIHDVNAVDISAPVGTTVHAAAAGTIIVAGGDGKYNGGYGNYIVVSHPNNTQTLYAHLSEVSVTLGEVVSQGEPIGLSGKTGKVTGAHLHFEIRGATNPWGSDTKGTAYSI
ncbi:MAG: LysM peptidoglycan-binding domain-containing protein [Candidatus Paceibacterota bacterium]